VSLTMSACSSLRVVVALPLSMCASSNEIVCTGGEVINGEAGQNHELTIALNTTDGAGSGSSALAGFTLSLPQVRSVL
jgi:hypothetical protein